MELFLHIGTNKTASSFLQTLQTKNKGILQKEAFYVPPSKYDIEMLSGKITPGNGARLANILCLPKKMEGELMNYFDKIIRDAKQQNCNKVVLSNEILVRLFSNEQLIKAVDAIAKKSGFVKLNVFCFLRNPYNHALSLYKHRMKSGRVLQYSHWLLTGYKTIVLFDQFIPHLKKFEKMGWMFRIYKKDPAYMTHVYFNDFLGLQCQIDPNLPKSINPSMSLKGIRIMSLIEGKRRGAGRDFHDYCMRKNIMISESVDLEQNFFLAYREYVQSFFCEIPEKMASLLRLEEQEEFLRIPIKESSIFTNIPLMYNEKELDAICETLKTHTSQKKLVTDSIDFLKRLKVKFFGKKQYFDAARYGGSLRNS